MSWLRCAALPFAFTLVACADDVVSSTAPGPIQQYPSMGMVSALVDDAPWTSGYVSVRHGGGLLRITAIGWGTTDDRQYLDLILEPTVGATQVIGPSKPPLATFLLEFYASWLASGDVGNGTIILTSLTEDRATGTFSFTGQLLVMQLPVGSTPQTRVVRNGSFDVRLR